NLEFQPLGYRVDCADADTMQARADFVAAVIELAARVKHRHYDLCRGNPLIVHSHRDPATVIRHRNGPVVVQPNGDRVAMTRKVLVDSVVNTLPD
ncbi:MAG: hypothetical protein RJA70_3657, partial [Pseudomonadota bacterium]